MCIFMNMAKMYFCTLKAENKKESVLNTVDKVIILLLPAVPRVLFTSPGMV